jgi:hypothetical protein
MIVVPGSTEARIKFTSMSAVLIRYSNKECSTGFTFHTAKHPLTPNRVSPMIFTPSEVTLFYFDGPVRAADLLRAAF